jgi:hypothetical protein
MYLNKKREIKTLGQKKEGSRWRPRLSETMKGAIPAIQLWGVGRKR